MYLHFFDELVALHNIYATSKIEIAMEWIKKENPKKAILIGDTTHDFDVSKAMSVDCILVASGHQNNERLMACGVPVFESIVELLKNEFFENLLTS
ncbi:MAG: hypothetical protein FWC47_05340 [Oscillospiraceae bacterium]|nr:hypothetical protein [Oscillospiraceae bacterium]